jgi:hypothetical protein
MVDNAERWLRPDPRRVALAAAWVAGAVWLSLAAFTAYAAVWWPGHGILNTTPAWWVRGTAALSLIVAAPFATAWLVERRVAWRVVPAGVAFVRGGVLHRSYSWAEIVSLTVLPFGAIARLADRPWVERLHWLPSAESRWLRAYAAERMSV